jgi:hypothetical protein
MAEARSSALRAEQELVAALLSEVVAELPEGLEQFVRSEMAEDRTLAAIVLASSAPQHDSAEAVSRRVALAAALELLQIALNIHRLLLAPAQYDTIDRFLLGGTILAGDYCFSRAAVLAARTCHPQVVLVFAELLKEVSQANLRRVINEDEAGPEAVAADERKALFHSGALAGALLAGLGEEEQARAARYASSLSRRLPPDSSVSPAKRESDGASPPPPRPIADASFDSESYDEADNLPPHQRERWRAIAPHSESKP